jgi:hypothetical protein
MREVLSARSMKFPGLRKPPAFVVHDGGVADAHQMQRGGFDLLKNSLGLCRQTLRASGERQTVKAVQFLPKLDRDLVAHHAGVFARLANGGNDGIGILRIGTPEIPSRPGRWLFVQFEKRASFVAGALHDGHPVFGQALVVEIAQIQQQLQVHIHDARDVFRALDVARHPVKTIGDAAKHGLFVSIKHPGVLAAAALRGIDHQRAGRNATRVRPPGTMVVFSP